MTALDRFTDEELLALCEVADLTAEKVLAGTATPAEKRFLAAMMDKELWTPKGGRG